MATRATVFGAKRVSLSVARARLRRHGQRGVTALEFALVGPLAIFIIVFAIEITVLLMADATLGRVAADISRRAQIEQLNSGNCQGDIRSLMVSGMKGWVFKPETIVVDQVEVFNPREPGSQGQASVPVRCSAAEPGGSVVFKVGFSSPGFSGVMAIFGIKLLRFERQILVQNAP